MKILTAITPPVGQAIMNATIQEAASRGRAARIKHILLASARRACVRAGDPTVSTTINGLSLRMPLSHQLPIYLRKFPHYSANFGNVIHELSKVRPIETVIDIGANVGDSVTFVRRFSDCPILCIEGDSHMSRYLQANAGVLGNITIVEKYLDQREGNVAAISRYEQGTARLVGNNGHFSSTTTLDSLLAEFPEFSRPSIIKVDTDGMDIEILLGALGVLRSAQPVVFFEYDPQLRQPGALTLTSFAQRLISLSYGFLVAYDNVGRLMSAFRLDDDMAVRSLDTYLAYGIQSFYIDVVVLSSKDEAIWQTIAATS